MKGAFSKSIGSFGVNTLGNAERVRRAIVLKLFSSVILDTPVDTGRLRGNWLTSQGSPKLNSVARVDSSGGSAIAEVQSNMGDGTSQDTSVFLSNNLPYAARIEYEGWSKRKAPQGMVRKNVARIEQLVSKAIKEGRL